MATAQIMASVERASQEIEAAKFLRGMTRRWRLPIEADSSPESVAGMSPLLVRLLAARGLAEADDILRFCEPKLSHLHDPALMPGIMPAAERIIAAVRRDESIIIYGDYDVDGITATAILYHLIKTMQPAARVRTYVPHRLEEGYGLNIDALRQLKTEGADLVITVDCGITAIEPANIAKEIGLDLIITDHHEVRSQKSEVRDQTSEGEHSDLRPLTSDLCMLPHALAVVHPRLPKSQYPFGDLCGAGVAFKLAWHAARLWCNSERVSEQLQTTLVNMLPLVALGTIADVVPLVGENRTLTAFGLRLIKATPLVGLRALIEAADLMNEKIDSERVGFVLAPRLNACGRMGHAADAVRLLTEATSDEAIVIARSLEEFNKERQLVERRIFDHAARLAEDAGMTGDDCRAIVLAHESWHPGVVGIVCSRLVERFGRPAILLNQSKNLCKGSARSIDGYSIHDALHAASSHLITFGGHAMAAGLSLEFDRLQNFADALIEHANLRITPDQLTPSIDIDCHADLAELTEDCVRQLQRLSPFGRGNRTPTILLRNLTLTEPPRQIGANGKHLSLRVRQQSNSNGSGNSITRYTRCVWWSAGERAADLAAGMMIDAVIEPRLNDWNGRISVEATIRDVRICPR